MLIDTRIRNNEPKIQAATIYGQASIIDDINDSKKIIEQLSNKYVSLLNLASDKNVCVVEIVIKSALLLENVDKSSLISFNKD